MHSYKGDQPKNCMPHALRHFSPLVITRLEFSHYGSHDDELCDLFASEVQKSY